MSPPLWFANSLSYCLQVLLLVLMGTALPALFRLRAPRVLLAYWQGLLVICLVLPVLQPWRPPAVASFFADGTVSMSFQGVQAGAADLQSWLYLLIAGVLLAGMLVRLAWLTVGLGRLRAILRAAQAFDPLPDCVRELELRLRVFPAWRLSPEIESPATFGIRPPFILLPERFPTMDKAFQRAIAGHELFHVVRNDWIFNLAEEIILTVFWFHPAVAWVVNRIRLSREQTVDAEMVRLISARKSYMSALLEIAGGSPGRALGAAPTFLKERQLAHRIELLVKEVTMSNSRLFLSLTGTAGLLILVGIVGVWAFPLRAPAPAAAIDQQVTQESAAPAGIAPKAASRVVFDYPAAWYSGGITGIVVLRVTVEKDGSVSNLEVLSGNPQLVKVALAALRQERFPPVEKVLTRDVTVNFGPVKSASAAPAQQAAKAATPPATISVNPVTRVQPVYPLEAKKAGIEGIVVLRATIEKDGSVPNLAVLSGNPQLVKAAIDAVRQWRYPAAEKVRTTDVTISFTLEKDGGLGPDRGAGVGGGVYTVGNGVSAPISIYKPEPPYTKEARAAKLQGTVNLLVVVGADGAVTDVKVTQGIDKGLTENAVRTVRTWKFQPAMKDGKPVPCKVKIEVSFRRV